MRKLVLMAATAALSEVRAGSASPSPSSVGHDRAHVSQWRGPASASFPASAASSRAFSNAGIAFQHRPSSGSIAKQTRQSARLRLGIIKQQHGTALYNDLNNDEASSSSSSFLSTSKANVSFKNTTPSNSNTPSNLSTIDSLLLTLTSDRTSLLLGSIGILVLFLNRLISFPEDAVYEASRSRIDLLGVFAAGSVLLNGITKLDVESVRAERVVLEGVNEGADVTWTTTGADVGLLGNNEKLKATVGWALPSFLKCSPARTAVLLATSPKNNQRWIPIARVGTVPSDPQLRSSIPESVTNTPILDRMLRMDGSIKGGTVGGTETSTSKKGPKESYLPTLQALPGKVEFTYLPQNAQEALILPVSRKEVDDDSDGWYYAVVLGGDTAKSFAPRDIAWCKEIASWIGDLV